jgi:drug/metabolite transporter (DMT)-like permease
MGELLAFLSTCFFAAANVTISRGTGPKGQENGAFLSILMTAGIAAIAWVYVLMTQGWPRIDPLALAWFGGAGILTIFIGRVFLYASVQHLGAVRASAVKRLNPVFSVMLGVLVLGEPVSSSMTVGMLLIFASFGVLIWQAMSSSKAGKADTSSQSWMATMANLGFFYGPISALAYATGYVARKQGLDVMPDAAFGTMFGSVVGAVCFVLAGQFVDSYRTAVRATFTTFNSWLFAAAVLSSIGQLLYFAALTRSTISRVALIASMEVFVTMFLTVLLFRSREQLTGSVLVAAGLGVIGTVFIVLDIRL